MKDVKKEIKTSVLTTLKITHYTPGTLQKINRLVFLEGVTECNPFFGIPTPALPQFLLRAFHPGAYKA